MKKNADKTDVLNMLKRINAKKALAMSLALTTASVSMPQVNGVFGPMPVYATTSNDPTFAAGVAANNIRVTSGLTDRVFDGSDQQGVVASSFKLYARNSSNSLKLLTQNKDYYITVTGGNDKPGYLDVKVVFGAADLYDDDLQGKSYTWSTTKVTGYLSSATVIHDPTKDGIVDGKIVPGLTVTLANQDITSDLGTGYTASYTYGSTGNVTVKLTAKEAYYSGSKSITIAASAMGYDLDKADVILADADEFDGTKAIEPAVASAEITVGSEKITLVKDTDYTLTYSDNTSVGKGKAILTGKGSYTGTTKEVEFDIAKDADYVGVFNASTLTVGSVASQLYTGNELTISPTVRFKDPITSKSSTLVRGTDFNVECYTESDFTGTAATVKDPGTYYVKLVGINNYAESEYNTAVSFNVTAALSTATNIAELTIPDQPYAAGSVIEPDVAGLKFGETALVKGTDYSITYRNNTNVGTGYATVTSTAYTGSVNKTFKIVAADLESDYKTVVNVKDEDFEADGKEKKPTVESVEIYAKDESDTSTADPIATLKLNTDYTVSYEDNVAAGTDTAKVIITGKGSFSGEVEETFTIDPYDLSVDNDAAVSVAAVSNLTYTGDTNVFKVTPAVTLATKNGNVPLTAGKDFNYSYKKYSATTNDYVDADAYDMSTTKYQVVITLEDPYDGMGDSEGDTITKDYTIGVDVSNSVITFTGQPITFDPVTAGTTNGIRPDFTTTLNGTTIADAWDYVVVQNNKAVGTATATFKVNTADGFVSSEAKTETFDINALNIGTLTLDTNTASFSDDSLSEGDVKFVLSAVDTATSDDSTSIDKLEFNYIGEGIDVTEGRAKDFALTYYSHNGTNVDKVILKQGTDYDISFGGNTSGSGAEITVNVIPKGNYTGSDSNHKFYIGASDADFTGVTLDTKNIPQQVYDGTTGLASNAGQFGGAIYLDAGLKTKLSYITEFILGFTPDGGSAFDNTTVGENKGSLVVTGAGGYEAEGNEAVVTFDVYGNLSGAVVTLANGEQTGFDSTDPVYQYYYRKATGGYSPSITSVTLGDNDVDASTGTTTGDYTSATTGNTDGATTSAKVTVTAAANSYYLNSGSQDFSIIETPIDDATIADDAKVTYGFATRDDNGKLESISTTGHEETFTGSEIKPDIVLYQGIIDNDNFALLEEGTDYTLSYDECTAVSDSAPTVTITPIGNFDKNTTDDIELNFKITTGGDLFTDANGFKLSGTDTTDGKIDDQDFDGTAAKEYKPAPTVSINIGGTAADLTVGTDENDTTGDYYIEITDNTEVGEATIKFIGINDYASSNYETTFNITCDLSTITALALEEAPEGGYTYIKNVKVQPELDSTTTELEDTSMANFLALEYKGDDGYSDATATVVLSETAKTFNTDNGGNYYYFSGDPIVLDYEISPAVLSEALVELKFNTYLTDPNKSAAADGVAQDGLGGRLIAAVNYTGSVLTPAVSSVSVQGEEYDADSNAEDLQYLTLGVDYKIIGYDNNTDAAAWYSENDGEGSITAPHVTIQGLGGYAGGTTDEENQSNITFSILPLKFHSASYTGTAVLNPGDENIADEDLVDDVSVMHAGKALTGTYVINLDSADNETAYEFDNADADYYIIGGDNDAIGSYSGSVTVYGMNNYEGSKVENVGFNIYGDLTHDDVTVVLYDADGGEIGTGDDAVTWTGSQIKPTTVKVYYGDDTTDALGEYSDYKLTYGTNTDVGKGTVTVTGNGLYTGTLNVEFDIAPIKWTESNLEVTFDDSILGDNDVPTGEYSWKNGSAVTPKPTVVYKESESNEITLKEGTDYKLEYDYNTDITDNLAEEDADNTPVVRIIGMGAYAATEAIEAEDGSDDVNIMEKDFEIVGLEIKDSYISAISKQYFTSDTPLTPGVTITVPATDTGTGKAIKLKEGDDFVIGVPSDPEDPTSVIAEGSDYANNDRPGLATVTVTGIGNYSSTAEADFEIWGYISQAEVEFTADEQNSDGNYDYTASAIEPSFTVSLFGVDITNAVIEDAADVSVIDVVEPAEPAEPAEDDKEPLPDGYSVAYSSNTSVGTRATLKLTGLSTGYMSGSKSEYFTISAAELTDDNIIFVGIEDKYEWTGSAVTIPDLKVYYLPDATSDAGAGDVTTPADPNSLVTTSETLPANAVLLTNNTDYTLSYSGNIAASTSAKVTVTGKGGFTGDTSTTFTIQKGEETPGAAVDWKDLDNDAKESAVENLFEDDVYVTVGEDGSISVDLGDRDDISELPEAPYEEMQLRVASGFATTQYYTGDPIIASPKIYVYINGKSTLLNSETDYMLVQVGNTGIGKAAVWAIGIGDYTGLGVTIEYDIKAFLSSFTVEILEQVLAEGDTSIELDLDDDITLSFGESNLVEDMKLKNSDVIKISGYRNNTKAGTAYATIVASDDYTNYLSGSKSATFTISEEEEEEEE